MATNYGYYRSPSGEIKPYTSPRLAPASSISSILGSNADPDTLNMLLAAQQQLGALPGDVNAAFETPSLDSFKEQAEKEISPFFDKETEILMQKIQVSKQKLESEKKLQDQALKSGKQFYEKQQDLSFADALRTASEGYSGRGLGQSGTRVGAMNRQIVNQDLATGRQQELFTEAQQQSDTGYQNNLAQNQLVEKQDQLSLDRSRNAALLQAQVEKQQQAALSNEGAQLSIKDFLNTVLGQKVSA